MRYAPYVADSDIFCYKLVWLLDIYYPTLRCTAVVVKNYSCANNTKYICIYNNLDLPLLLLWEGERSQIFSQKLVQQYLGCSVCCINMMLGTAACCCRTAAAAAVPCIYMCYVRSWVGSGSAKSLLHNTPRRVCLRMVLLLLLLLLHSIFMMNNNNDNIVRSLVRSIGRRAVVPSGTQQICHVLYCCVYVLLRSKKVYDMLRSTLIAVVRVSGCDFFYFRFLGGLWKLKIGPAMFSLLRQTIAAVLLLKKGGEWYKQASSNQQLAIIAQTCGKAVSMPHSIDTERALPATILLIIQ